MRSFVLWSLVGLALAGIVGVGLAFRAYDEATKIDRRFGEVVVREYVAALLDRRDSLRAELFECSDSGVNQPIHTMLADLMAQERAHDLSTEVSVIQVSAEDGGTLVYAEIQIRQAANGLATKEVQRWQFRMVEEDGWRVCGAERVPDPTPTPSATPPTTPSPQ